MRLSKIKTMKGIIDGSFSGNQVTYTLDRANRNYIIEMVMNAEASSAYFLYPAIAESFIKSIKSNWQNNLRSSVKKMLTLLVKRHKKKKQH